MLAALREDWDAADQHFARAVEQNQAIGARMAVAYTRFAWADALTEQSGAESKMAALLDQARDDAVSMGMTALLGNLDEDGAPRDQSSDGPPDLTFRDRTRYWVSRRASEGLRAVLGRIGDERLESRAAKGLPAARAPPLRCE